MAQTNLKNIPPHPVSYHLGIVGDFLFLKQASNDDLQALNISGIQP